MIGLGSDKNVYSAHLAHPKDQFSGLFLWKSRPLHLVVRFRGSRPAALQPPESEIINLQTRLLEITLSELFTNLVD